MCPKLKALTYSDITGLVIKKTRSLLGHIQDLLATVMMWLSDCETNDLQK